MTNKRTIYASCVLLAALIAGCSGSTNDATPDAGSQQTDTSSDTNADTLAPLDTMPGTDGCAPACDGLECGDDGCGGTCGGCTEGKPCIDGMCYDGCHPNCSWQDECGADGCGGNCGLCEEGVDCQATKFGQRCTVPCELFTCPEGEICLFGHCFDEECKTDDDCGAPEHYCDKFHRCLKRTPCQSTEDCTAKAPDYCNEDVGFCFYDGHCWDNGDCPGGTCDADHWCREIGCYWDDDGPGCPPDEPICALPYGEMPRCDGGVCSSCVAPCVFDHDCPEGTLCGGSQCWPPGNDCDLDSECGEGSYCHPGCTPLKPTCETEADCGGTLCLLGYCVGDQVVECDTDAVCEAWAEGVSCQDGVCKPIDACVVDSQCGEGEYCAWICLPLPDLPDCTVDAHCPAGQVCQNETCVDPPECVYDVQCPAGHVCEEKTCYNDAGVCAWLEKGPDFCDDGDPCTADACGAVTGCVHAPGGCP